MDVKDNPSPVSVTTTPLMVPIEKEGQKHKADKRRGIQRVQWILQSQFVGKGFKQTENIEHNVV